MVANLSRLYLLAGRQEDRERAETILRTYGPAAAANPFAYATLLNAFDDHLNRVDAVIIGGEGGSALHRAVHDLPAVDPAVAFLQPGERVHAGHPANGKVAREGHATAYLCRGTRCSLPVVDPADLAAAYAALS
jgi:uncharacterized protein YyaL (SSP411 family)